MKFIFIGNGLKATIIHNLFGTNIQRSLWHGLFLAIIYKPVIKKICTKSIDSMWLFMYANLPVAIFFLHSLQLRLHPNFFFIFNREKRKNSYCYFKSRKEWKKNYRIFFCIIIFSVVILFLAKLPRLIANWSVSW